MPLPRPETTPPVTKMCLAMGVRASLREWSQALPEPEPGATHAGTGPVLHRARPRSDWRACAPSVVTRRARRDPR